MSRAAAQTPSPASPEFAQVFARLRGILVRTRGGPLVVTEDSARRYCLEGKPGPATLAAWRGKQRKGSLQVAWVECGKSYVSFHHMAFYGSASLHAAMSPALKQRMQGKTCFNFRAVDEALFAELETLSRRGAESMRSAGFVA